MSGDVFISYRHGAPDVAYVDMLAAFLTAAGIPVWFDKEIISGDRWDDVIRHHIDTCAALVVVMTPAAETSLWIKREIAQAEKTGKAILPLLLAGDCFFRLSDLRYDDVTGEQMPSARFVARLRELLPTQAPTAAQPPLFTAWFIDVFTSQPDAVWSVAWSPDGRHLATTSLDQAARIWQVGDL